MQKGFKVTFQGRERIITGRVLASGGRNTKNATVYVSPSEKYKVPYGLILSFTDKQGNTVLR